MLAENAKTILILLYEPYVVENFPRMMSNIKNIEKIEL